MCIIGINKLKEKIHIKIYVELLMAMYLQLKFKLILTNNKAPIDNF